MQPIQMPHDDRRARRQQALEQLVPAQPAALPAVHDDLPRHLRDQELQQAGFPLVGGVVERHGFGQLHHGAQAQWLLWVGGVVRAHGVDDGVAEAFAFECVREEVGVGRQGVVGGELAEGRGVEVLNELLEGADGEVGFAESRGCGGSGSWRVGGVVVGDEEGVVVVVAAAVVGGAGSVVLVGGGGGGELATEVRGVRGQEVAVDVEDLILGGWVVGADRDADGAVLGVSDCIRVETR